MQTCIAEKMVVIVVGAFIWIEGYPFRSEGSKAAMTNTVTKGPRRTYKGVLLVSMPNG